MAASLLSTASSYFARSPLSNYTISSPAGTPSTSSSQHPPSSSRAVTVGLWKVQTATHNTTSKTVSVWTFEKGSLSSKTAGGGGGDGFGSHGGGGGAGGKGKGRLDRVVEVLKKEVSSLTRLRHPCILEMVEPVEETRSSLSFATEPITSSLSDAIESGGSRRGNRFGNSGASDEGLDEVEIQKGLSQLGKGLQFLHESAKLVHANLTPDAVIINAKGDWKISGFGLSTYLTQPDGTPAKWEFPEHDSRLPDYVQRNFDFMAPEYALDEQLLPSNDLYSLGAIIFAIHTKSGPPFSNRGSLNNLRSNMENLNQVRATWSKLGAEVQDVISQLLTRYPSTRLTASSFQTSRYFSSVLVSTLKFLDRDTFNAKQKEEQTSFMKGLINILPQFSDKVIKRKILPSLLEETRKVALLPFLLPNIFYIAERMDADEFKDSILPQIKPLFIVKDPPQNVLTLIDNLPLFQGKCSAVVFREEVMPLIYTALESEVPVVLDRALKAIPSLSESLDYTTVKTTLFPKIAAVFTKTTMLSVKVSTLICFHSMVKILDKYTLTEKLVPLLSKIKTKEPSVMLATLAVHEEMGSKVEIDAIATLILPQLWAMSMGPLLNATQFAKFMSAVKKLGARVEEEHSRHLAELRRLEESTVSASMASAKGENGEIDFEALVRGNGVVNGKTQIAPDPFFGDDGSPGPSQFVPLAGASLPSSVPSTPPVAPTNLNSASTRATSAMRLNGSAPTSSAKAASILGARAIPPSTFNASAFPNEVGSFGAILPPPSAPPPNPAPPHQMSSFPPPLMPSTSSTPIQPKPPLQSSSASGPPKPNYNIFLPPQAPAGSSSPRQSMSGLSSPPLSMNAPLQSPFALQPSSTPAIQPTNQPVKWNVVPPPSFGGSGGGILHPNEAPQRAVNGNGTKATGLGDFDPFA